MEELEATTSSAELTEWAAFYRIEPWGFEMENWRMAQIAATTANFSGRIKKPLKPIDFLPREPKSKQQTALEYMARLRATLGGNA